MRTIDYLLKRLPPPFGFRISTFFRPSAFGFRFSFLAAALALLQPVTASACAVCYGDPSSPVSAGLTWAITALGVIVVGVLGGVVAFFVHANRKAALLAAQAQPSTLATNEAATNAELVGAEQLVPPLAEALAGPQRHIVPTPFLNRPCTGES